MVRSPASMFARHLYVTGLRMVMLRDRFRAVRVRAADVHLRLVEVVGGNFLLSQGTGWEQGHTTDRNQQRQQSDRLHTSSFDAWLTFV